MLHLLISAVLFSNDPQLPPQSKADVQKVAESGRCVTLSDTPDKRVAPPPAIAPGPPPILSFRLYEGKRRGHFNNSELMLDDAGH